MKEKMQLLKEPDYEKLADKLAIDNYALLDKFIPEVLIDELLEAFTWHREQDNFHKAGIGHLHNFAINREIRGDQIKWIEKGEALPPTLKVIERIEELMRNLNRLLFLSLKDYECHFALYPPGAYYERHLDQFKNSNNRKISFALYLNRHWKVADGGQLRLYLGDLHEDIAPLAGRLALFRSDTVEHEVLLSHTDRYSITGWMLDSPADLPYLV